MHSSHIHYLISVQMDKSVEALQYTQRYNEIPKKKKETKPKDQTQLYRIRNVHV